MGGIIRFFKAAQFYDDFVIVSSIALLFFQAIDSQTKDSLPHEFSYDPPFYVKMIPVSTIHRLVNFTVEVCGKDQKFSRLKKVLF